jgi:hypothetical protein
MAINGLQDVNYSTVLIGTNAPRVIDDAVREVAEGTKKSFHEDAAHARHHAAGDLKIPRNTVAALEAALASPVAGDLRFNASTGNLEIRIAADITYTGTLSEDMPDAATVVDSSADFLNQVAAFPTAAANRETDATISIGGNAYETIWEVDSASQLTLAADYTAGIQVSGAAYIVRLKTAGSWYPISDVLTNFMDEHYRTGEHKIIIQTDGSAPTNVRNNQFWVNWQNNILDAYVHVAGTTRQLSTGVREVIPHALLPSYTGNPGTSYANAATSAVKVFVPSAAATLVGRVIVDSVTSGGGAGDAAEVKIGLYSSGDLAATTSAESSVHAFSANFDAGDVSAELTITVPSGLLGTHAWFAMAIRQTGGDWTNCTVRVAGETRGAINASALTNEVQPYWTA